ncbi:hypothetical protein [Acetobacter musti]|uniref:hypothetical protein n=1 Tax=Acetobacter musti TaxID=864732 RepID=UPI00156B2FD7|nr:hypothetical protein [Acetobacter musti]
MKIYSVWLPGPATPRRKRKDGLPVMVPQRTAWLVLLLGWVGLAILGARIAGMLAGAALILGLALLSGTWLWLPVILSGRFALAVFSHELIGWELQLHGYVPDGVVAGPDADAALLRYMDRVALNGGPMSGGGSGPDGGVPDPFAIAFGRPAAGAAL